MPKHWNEANNVRFGKKADIRQTKTPAQLPGFSLFATTAAFQRGSTPRIYDPVPADGYHVISREAAARVAIVHEPVTAINLAH
jgi:hypothetical protein